jgi:tetratricopeptide (TPR) repeat protein
MKIGVVVAMAVLFICGCGSQRTAPNVGALLDSAQKARDAHSDASCIATYTEALAAQPGLVTAYTGRAQCYVDSGNAAPAVNDYDQAIRISSQDPELFIDRAAAEQLIGNYSAAKTDLLRAGVSSSANPTQTVRVAESLGQLGFYADALTALDSGLNRYRGFWDLHRYRGEIEAILGDDQQALAEFKNALNAASGANAAFVLATRADFYVKRNDFTHAVADLNEAVLASPNQYWLFDSRAKARSAAGDLDGARSDLTRAIGLVAPNAPPNSRIVAKLLEERGQLFLQQGQKAKASADFRRALELTDASDLTFRSELQSLVAEAGA